MRSILAEKTPGDDLPFYIEMATGDAATIYATDAIASLDIKDWDGNVITGITIASSFNGSQVLLRISGGTINTTYYIKVKAALTNPNYVDEVFVTLNVKQPSKT